VTREASPRRRLFQVLSQNVQMYNKLPVQIFNVGLARYSGRADFTRYAVGSISSIKFQRGAGCA
jgi:hypothetical protein